MSGTKTIKNGEGKMKTKLISILFAISLMISIFPAAYASTNILPVVTSFTVTPISTEVLKPVAFVATASDSDGFISNYVWDFGDGTSDTTSPGTTSHVYRTPGNYLASVTAVDNDGGAASDTEWIMIKQIGLAPYVSLQASHRTIETNKPITFIAVGEDLNEGGSITTYMWDYGDGREDTVTSSAITDTKTKTFSTPGDYLVTVTVVNEIGKAASDTEWITVTRPSYQNPIAIVSATPISGEAPLTVSFTGSGTAFGGATITNYAWDFNNDGVTDSNKASDSHTYNTPGNYKATLTVVDSNNKVGTKDEWIMVKTPGKAPYVSLQADKVSGNAPMTVNFLAVGEDDDGTIVSYAWDFNGDGVTDKTGASATETFSTPGNYLVTVTVVDNSGKAASDTEWIMVKSQPVVTITASPISGEAPLTVDFSATATGTTGGIAKYEWDFNGDGVTDSTSSNPEYTFTTPANQKVTLRIEDGAGAEAFGEEWIMVKAPGKAPYVSLQADKVSGEIPMTVNFNAIAEDDDGTIERYMWDFNGDGVTDSTLQNPIKTYNTPGNYLVTVTVVDNSGKAASDTEWIMVKAKGKAPYVSLQADPISGEAPLQVSFNAIAEDDDGTIEQYMWDFDGDGSTDSEVQNPVKTYQTPGNYLVTVTVVDNSGKAASDTEWIMVKAPGQAPTVTMTANPKEGKAPLDVNFNAIAKDTDGTIEQYMWDFDGDGSTDSEVQSPTHRYNTPGNYLVTVTVVDNSGKAASDTEWILVEKSNIAPSVAIYADPSQGETPLTVSFTAVAYDEDGTIVSYEWDLDGDGSIDRTGRQVEYIYTEVGDHLVEVVVTDNDGLTASDDQWITVTDETYELLVQLNADRTNVNIPDDQVTFTAVATSSRGQTVDIARYEWDFDGDGSIDRTTSTNVAVHQYTLPDMNYAARVTAFDNNGQYGSDEVMITTQRIIVDGYNWEFFTGWNYVQLPARIVPISNDITSVLSDLDYEIAWKDNSGTWQFYLPSESVGEFNTIDHGVDYWILSNENKNVTVPVVVTS